MCQMLYILIAKHDKTVSQVHNCVICNKSVLRLINTDTTAMRQAGQRDSTNVLRTLRRMRHCMRCMQAYSLKLTRYTRHFVAAIYTSASSTCALMLRHVSLKCSASLQCQSAVRHAAVIILLFLCTTATVAEDRTVRH